MGYTFPLISHQPVYGQRIRSCMVIIGITITLIITIVLSRNDIKAIQGPLMKVVIFSPVVKGECLTAQLLRIFPTRKGVKKAI